jgi:hypothetical protein
MGKKNAVFFNILATMGKTRNTVYAEALTLLRSAVRRTSKSAYTVSWSHVDW